MLIQVGPYEVIGEGTVIGLPNESIKFIIEDLTFELAFKNIEEETGQRVEAKPFQNNKGVTLIFINFNNSLGTGNILPIPLGFINDKDLYLNYRIYALNDSLDKTEVGKTVHYTWLTKKKGEDQMSNSNVNIPNISELNIYEGGSLNEIRIADLMNNETAIKQLINSHNIKIKEVHTAQAQIAELKSELEYQKTSPFLSIITLVINLLGSTVSALAVNFLSSEKPPEYTNSLLFIGFILVFVGSLGNILYPYARNFFNKKREEE